MKVTALRFKEIAIILAYAYQLIACYFFHWKPFGIFISYLIEVLVLLGIYAVLRAIDEKRTPQRYVKSQPIINLFIGIVPLVLFQYFMIGLISVFIDPEQDFTKRNLLLSKEVMYAVVSMLILYIFTAVKINKHSERLAVFQGNFIFKSLALTATNILAMVLVFIFEIHALLPVLTGMVVIRVALELYFERMTKAE